MFVLIWTFIPFVFIIWNITVLKRRKLVTFEIKRGIICWECKNRLNTTEEELWKRIGSDKDYSSICNSCNRDIKIKSLKNKFFSYRKSIQEYLICGNSNKLIYIFISIVLFLVALDIILKLSSIDIVGLQWLYGGVNIFYWSIMVYRSYITTIKKPSDI